MIANFRQRIGSPSGAFNGMSNPGNRPQPQIGNIRRPMGNPGFGNPSPIGAPSNMSRFFGAGGPMMANNGMKPMLPQGAGFGPLNNSGMLPDPNAPQMINSSPNEGIPPNPDWGAPQMITTDGMRPAPNSSMYRTGSPNDMPMMTNNGMMGAPGGGMLQQIMQRLQQR